MTYRELQTRISAALEEPGVKQINSAAFYAACDKHGIEAGDLEDAIRDTEFQAREDRDYNHWSN
jgi:hypothetical protein